MKEYDKIFNSETDKNLKKIQLANGHISNTTILFEREGIVVGIESKGHIRFCDNKGKSLISFDVPAQTGGKEVYDEVLCAAEGGVISLHFPIVEWIDNYPNCDGEFDRWDTQVIGHHIVKFDPKKRDINLS